MTLVVYKYPTIIILYRHFFIFTYMCISPIHYMYSTTFKNEEDQVLLCCLVSEVKELNPEFLTMHINGIALLLPTCTCMCVCLSVLVSLCACVCVLEDSRADDKSRVFTTIRRKVVALSQHLTF